MKRIYELMTEAVADGAVCRMTARRIAAAALTALALTACATTTAEPDEPAHQVDVPALGDPTGTPPAHGQPGHDHTTDHQP